MSNSLCMAKTYSLDHNSEEAEGMCLARETG